MENITIMELFSKEDLERFKNGTDKIDYIYEVICREFFMKTESDKTADLLDNLENCDMEVDGLPLSHYVNKAFIKYLGSKVNHPTKYKNAIDLITLNMLE